MRTSYARLAGMAAVAAALGGIVYSATFSAFLASGSVGAAKVATVVLFGGGFVLMVVWVGIGARLRAADPELALLATVLGVVGAAGSAIHGAYDLANFVKPPASNALALSNYPNAVDPRGLATFGIAGLAILVASWSIARTGAMPRRLATVGTVAGVLLLIVFFGRMVILNPKEPFLLACAVASGFLVTPAWYALAGRSLLAEPAAAPS